MRHERLDACWTVALDELGGLVATLPYAELKVGEAALHARGLPVTEHQLAVVVHQVDELIDVVTQHVAKRLFPKDGE